MWKFNLMLVSIGFISTLGMTKAEGILVIAHRGASGDLPEHTLEAYELGVKQGAQVIEPDLVMTKDGVLICRHENELSVTTNVADLFPDRKVTKTIEGQKITGWFSEDFSLSEIKKLRVKQRYSNRNQAENWKYSIPSFAEFLAAMKKYPQVGIAPEIKHSKYFQSLKLNAEKAFLKELQNAEWPKNHPLTFIQSFEVENLKTLKKALDSSYKWQLVQLIGDPNQFPADAKFTFAKMISPKGLKDLRQYVDWVSPHRSLLNLSKETVLQIHQAGLKLMTYTYRLEDKDVGNDSNFYKIHELAVHSRVQAIFSDYPGKSREILSAIKKKTL